MGYKISDKVILSPQDKQYNWKDIKGVNLIGMVGEIVRDEANYYDKKYGAYHGYTVTFGLQHTGCNGDHNFVIEGRHLVKVNDDHDALGYNEPNKITTWKDSVWQPKEVKAK